jgi:hypothetical protein
LRHVRSLADVQAWLSLPNTGTCETAAAPFWRLLPKYRPDARVVVVRRPVEEVVESLMRLDMGGEFAFDRPELIRAMWRFDAKLRQMALRLPNVLSVEFSDLKQESVCARIFEHCLPYKHDSEWWQTLDAMNLQCSMPALMRYEAAYRPQLVGAAAVARHAMLADLAIKKTNPPEGMTIQRESFESWYRDGQHLFAEHSTAVGEPPFSFETKNIPLFRALDALGSLEILTGRSNGRMFGYLATIYGPSLEGQNMRIATQTAFYVSPDIPGLGTKLQRAAVRSAREGGADEIWFRAGPRGSGPKMGALYSRLGARPDGQVYRLNLRGD